MAKEVKPLAILVLKSMVENVVSKISPYTISPEVILAFYSHFALPKNIHRSLENVICHSDRICQYSKYFLHLVFKTSAKCNQTVNELTKCCKNVIGDQIQLNARLKSDNQGSELLITFENGIIEAHEMDTFLEDTKKFFGIDHQPIGVKCVFIYSRPGFAHQTDQSVSKVFFKPLRKMEEVGEEILRPYIANSLCYMSKMLSNQFNNIKKGDHMFTHIDYSKEVLNYATCPCQSYICSGGIDAEFCSKLRVCSLTYCDTHPFFQ